MGILVIDNKACDRLLAYALTNFVKVNKDTIKTMKPIGDNPNHVLILGSYRVVLSCEDQGDKGIHIHLSVSCLDKEHYPTPTTVSEIMKAFSFRKALEESIVWVEEELKAINVLEPLLNTHEWKVNIGVIPEIPFEKGKMQ